ISVQLVGDWRGPTRELACRFSRDPLPHPAPQETPETVRAALRERLTRFIQKPENEGVLGAAAPDPERLIPASRRAAPVTEPQWHWVNLQVNQVERLLFESPGGC